MRVLARRVDPGIRAEPGRATIVPKMAVIQGASASRFAPERLQQLVERQPASYGTADLDAGARIFPASPPNQQPTARCLGTGTPVAAKKQGTRRPRTAPGLSSRPPRTRRAPTASPEAPPVPRSSGSSLTKIPFAQGRW
jgi:hypothetical protein